MCTSIISNRKKTIVGWNLDLLDMEYRVSEYEKGVFIEINDAKEGWLPLFGANNRGDFVGMPTCWPFDERSNPDVQSNCDRNGNSEASEEKSSEESNIENVIMLDIDLLTEKKKFSEIKEIARNNRVCSVPGVTFMSSLSDVNGNVLHIIPGQGYKYYEKPVYQVLTNFSPFKMDKEQHPWMGWDRYETADRMLKEASDDFSVSDCFEILRAVSQEVCPTVVSMVFDVTDKKVYWCENRNWADIKEKVFYI